MNKLYSFVYTICAVITAMIGYTMYHELLIAIICGIFAPITCAYWLITHQINLSIIKETFSFFLK